MTDEIMRVRQEAAYRAWLDLTSEFSEFQRMFIAKHMSHRYTIERLTLRGPDGDEIEYTVKRPA